MEVIKCLKHCFKVVNQKLFSGSLGAFKRIITNPLVMCCLASNTFAAFGLFGYMIYKSKYIESQFRQSSSAASFITGGATFLPTAIGIFLGGAILTCFKPRPRFVFIMVFLCEAFYIVSFGSGFFLGCDPLKISGSSNNLEAFTLNTSCNAACDCSTSVFTPICGPDQTTTYFSPCHAGCRSFSLANSVKLVSKNVL